MEEILKGTSILIGRDSSTSKLLIVVAKGEQPAKGAFVGEGKVPLSVSRCKPKEKIAHCKIDIDVNGRMILYNLKGHNTTYVDDDEIDSKKITTDSKISLGCHRYAIDIKAILSAAEEVVKFVDKNTPYSIAHLEPIWNEYEEEINKIDKEKQLRLKIRTLSTIFTLSASVIGGGLNGNGYEDLARFSWILGGIGLLILVWSFFLWRDRSKDKIKQAKEKLLDNYVCPNTDCRHFMGYIEFKILKQNKKCPYCGHALKDH